MTRPCLMCPKVDDHPRHIIHIGDAELPYHMDCHAAANPPCESCATQLHDAHGATGDDLRAHLTKGR